MLQQVLEQINNWFLIRDGGNHLGTFTIADGKLPLPFMQNGQYFAIWGSIFNDGLHQYGQEMEALQDETFTGAVWALAVPKAVVELANEIAAWQAKYGARAMSPYSSESLAGQYSYTIRSDPSTGQSSGWQGVFRERLNRWRKV